MFVQDSKGKKQIKSKDPSPNLDISCHLSQKMLHQTCTGATETHLTQILSHLFPFSPDYSIPYS